MSYGLKLHTIHAIHAVFGRYPQIQKASDSVEIPVLSLYEPCHDYTLEFSLPEKAEAYLICAKIEGGLKGRINVGMYCKSMIILDAQNIAIRTEEEQIDVNASL